MLMRRVWTGGGPAAAAALALAATVAAGATAAQGFAVGATLLVALARAWPIAARWGAAVVAAAATSAVLLDAGPDPRAAELSRVLAATVGLCALACAVDAALPHGRRSGFWAGAVGTAVAVAGVSLALSMLGARVLHHDAATVALVLVALGAAIVGPAVSGSARASVAAWLAAGVGLGAAAGAAVGSIDLPRLGTASNPVPLFGALVAVLCGRAIHELAESRVPQAHLFAMLAGLIAAGNLGVVLAAPDWLAPMLPDGAAGARVEPLREWWMPPAVSVAVLLMVGLMVLTRHSAYARFGWTVGWLCGLLLSIVGSLGLAGWVAGAAVPVPGGLPLSAVGSLAMLLLGFAAMQLASAAMQGQRQRAVWLPAAAAVVIAGASVLAWREAEEQERALREQRTALVLEQAARGVRESVVSRTEALGRMKTALRLAPAERRRAVFEREADHFARDFPGAVSIFVAGPDRIATFVHRVERAALAAPGQRVDIDALRSEAYDQAQARSRAVMLGPVELSQVRGAGYLLIVPVQIDGAIHFVVASGRYAPLIEPVFATLPAGFDIEVAARDVSVYQRRAVGDRSSAAPRAVTIEVLRTPWRIALRESQGAPGVSGLPRTILFAGLLLAVLFATTLRLSALARERANAVAAAAEAQLAAQRALAASRAEAARVLDTMAEAVLSLDREQRINFANARARTLLGPLVATLPPAGIERVLPRGIGTLDPSAIARLCRESMDDGGAREIGGYSPDLAIWLAGRVQPVGDGVTVVLQDVSLARRAEAFQREQREILREIAEGVALETVLSRVCTLYDELHPGSSCSVALYDPQRACLLAGVAPGLPREYGAAIDGVPIGPAVGSCGTAMFRRERVVVTDIATDPLWGGFQQLATRLGLAACWSQPFLSRDGEPLGSLAVYWRQPREPTPAELSALETLAAICAIAVERDRSLRAQAESEQRFRSLFDHQPDGVFAVDLDGRVTAINEAVVEMTGHSRRAIVARAFDVLIEEQDRARVRGYFGRALAGEAQRYSTRGLRADGARRELDVTNLPIVVDGRIVGVYGVVRDVTEQRAAQARLLERDRFFELSPTVFAISDGQGRFTQVNDAFPRLLGLEREVLLARRITDLLVPEDVDPTLEAYRGMQETGRMGGFVNRYRTAEGGIRWLEWNALRLDEGSIFGVAIDVTATMEARQQEHRLLRAIGEGPAVLWRFNPYRTPSAEMVTANVSRWGYAPKDFTSGRLRFIDLVHPDDQHSVLVDDIARIESGDDQFSREYRMRTADGRWVWVSEHLQTVRDAAGRLDFCLALSLDVTEERQAREEERQLRQVIELSPAVLWRFNFDAAVPTRLASANVRAWGYEPEDFTSGRLRFADLIHPSDRERVYEAAQAAIRDGTRELQLEYQFRTAEGRWLWLDERMTILRGPRGEPGDCISLILDVTPRHEALAAVHERDQFYSLSLDVFLVAGADARIRQVNEALPRVLGFDAAHFVGRKVLDFLHPDDVGEMQRQIVQLGAGRRVDMAEFRCRHADGGWRWLEWNAAPGAGGLFYCAGRDITASKAVAAELRRALRDLELRNAELQDFAFVASHDLQEPLRKVQAFSDRVLARYADRLDPQGVDYLRRMDAAAGRMQSLIDDLLAYSRVSTRGGSFGEVDLERVLDDVLADLETRIEAGQGEVVRGPLPTVSGDPTQLRQVLQNLVGNALKFALPGRRPRVEVRAEPIDDVAGGVRRDGWRLVVADNGIGFDNAHADRIFAPFQRLHGRSEYEGTGIGLAIVRKIVERHGGTVTADGVPGVGATFTVELPAARPGARRDASRVPAIVAGTSA